MGQILIVLVRDERVLYSARWILAAQLTPGSEVGVE